MKTSAAVPFGLNLNSEIPNPFTHAKPVPMESRMSREAWRVRRINLGLVQAVFMSLSLALPARAAQRQILGAQHVPPAVATATPTGEPSRWSRLDLSIGLPLRNQEALALLLQQIYDPISTNYHQYLTPEQFAARFGPTEQDYQAVVAFAQMRGLTVTGTHPNRTLVDVKGAVGDIERAFHMKLHTYQHPNEDRTFFAPDSEPSVELAVPILAVSGLDNYVVPRPLLRPIPADKPHSNVTGSGPGGYFLGYDFRHAYAPGTTLDGTGQIVGLFELDGYYPHDIVAYKALAGLPDVTVTNVLLDGFNGSAGSANIEVALDIEMAIAIAPGLSAVIVYEGLQPNSVLNRIATDRQARQISASWTYSINATTIQIFQQYAVQGQSFYNASGDSGAYAGAPSPPTDNPYITSVGGTLLTTVGNGGPWVSETTWPYSSGGISTTYAIPTWQQGISMTANQGSTTKRNLPDVSMIADNVWIIYNNGVGTAVGGTSVSAPLWAGYTALINQLALANGEPLVGFINPAVYALGKTSSYTSAFHDITTGNNENSGSPTKFVAVSGYDLCTGWGTPAGNNLITALALPEPLRITPASATIISGPVGGPFNPATQTFSLTNNAGGTLNWTLVNTSLWLNVSPTSGSLVPGGGATAVTVSLTGLASSLVAGSYSTVLGFTNLNTSFGQSRPITLAVVTPPVITSQPADQAVFQGAVATFAVGTADNALLYYRWLKGGTPVSDGGNLSGSTTSTLNISNVTTANIGSYSVIVSNAAGVATSSNAALTITPSAPVITIQPTNQTVLPGAPVTFNVVAVGNTPYYYQWQFNRANLANGIGVSGVTTSNLSLSNASPANAGTYSVVITNSLGSTISAGAVLTLIPVTAPGVSLATLSSFNGSDGEYPYSPLTQGHDLNFYGTASQGGANGYGTVFRVTTNGTRTTLLAFNYTSNAGIPYAGLMLGRDGNFYGTAFEGDGTFGDGTMFRITTGGVLATLLRFNGNNGMYPVGGLVQGLDSFLYGTTLQGGVYGAGTVFKVTTGGALTTLVSFNGTDGSFPSSVLVQGSDGSFYGTTESGGTNGGGTVFKVTATGVFTLLHSFGGDDGLSPVPGLVQASDGYFYGNTIQGGTNGGFGTVFKISSSGVFTSLYSFAGDTNGANPWGGLVQANDGNLYGTAQAGGAYGFGIIFRIAPNGPLAKLADFDGYNGATPSAAMVQGTDGNLYGTTQTGGSSGFGTIFRLSISAPLQITGQPADQDMFLGETAVFNVATFGSPPVSYQWRKGGNNLTDGGNVSGSSTRALTITNVAVNNVGIYSVVVSNASGSLTSADAVLEVIYAPPLIIDQPASQTRVTGSAATFTVEAEGDEPLTYQWLMNGTNLTDGGNITGSSSASLLITSLTTANAGVYSVMVSNLFDYVHSMDATLTVVPATAPGVASAILRAFADSADGAIAYEGLIQARDNFLYGTASGGGSRYYGTLYRISLGGAFSTVYSFTDGTGGAYPYGRVVQAPNTYLYGATYSGGANGYGTIFRTTTAGTMAFLYSFSGGNDGAYPYAGLTLAADGNLYGTASQGGANSLGAIFKLTPTGAFTPLYSFTGYGDGAYPYAPLALGADGKLYGTTLTGGGTNGYGTVFQISTNGVLSTLVSFGYTNGASPQAGIVQGADGKLYGVTYQGGAFGYGTVFQLTTNGVLTTLASFNYTNGANPIATLCQGTDGNFYGTTSTGGAGGEGTVFRITPGGNLITLLFFDGFNGAGPQGTLLQANDGYFYGTTTYGGPGYNRTSGGGYGLIYRLTVPIFSTSPFTMPSAIAALPYSGNISAQARAGSGDVLTFAKVSGPAWLSVSNNGALSGTPAVADFGTNLFLVSLADTNGFYATATMKLVVNSNRPPSFLTSPFAEPWANVDQPYSGSIATNATDPELALGDMLTFAKVSGPAWLMVAADGTLTGTPQGLNGGTNTFVVSVTDLADSTSTATMSLYVNSTPYFLSKQFVKPAATVGLPYAGSIAANATDPDLAAGDYLTFYKVNGPAWLGVAPDGTLAGTPGTADLGPGISLVLVIDSGGLAGIGYLGITVVTNSPPIFTSSPFTAPDAHSSLAYSASIATSATDPNLGDTLTFSKISGPAWLTIAGNGALSGTPAAADGGANSFLVRVTDEGGLFTQATMNLNVVGPLTLALAQQDGQLVLSWQGGKPPYQVQGAINDLTRVTWSNVGGLLATNRLFLTPSNNAAWYRVLGQP